MGDLFVDMIRWERSCEAGVLGEVLIVGNCGFEEELLKAVKVGSCARHQVPYEVVTRTDVGTCGKEGCGICAFTAI